MKKFITCLMGIGLLMSGCGSYMGAGAYTGSSIGSVLGSKEGKRRTIIL